MTKKQFTLKQKIRYFFDNTLSAGTIAIIAWLAVISFLIILISAIVIAAFGLHPEGDELGFFEALWQSLMRTIDSGTVAGDTNWLFRIWALIITIGGIFIVSSLIGALTSGLERKLEELRKGRSIVLESGHTLILGWNSKILTIINELIVANENQKKPRIVIMSEKDKAEMEDIINAEIDNRKNTKIICRSGSALNLTDLKIVNPHEAKSIIILPDSGENPDIDVIKSVLAITNNLHRKKEKYHIVAEIKDEENIEAATLVGGDETSYIFSPELIARVAAQTCRQSGLSVVYTELLDFAGDEIYLISEPSLVGKAYKEIIFAYETSAVFGILKNTGTVLINPNPNTLYEKGDKIITISFDDDTVVLTDKKPVIDTSIFATEIRRTKQVERNLIMGWNRKAPLIIKELDQYVEKGSELTILADGFNIENQMINLQDSVINQKIEFIKGNITKRKTIEDIHIESFNNIIILGYPLEQIQEADAKTLICLLHIRNISEKEGKAFNVVSEMYDIRNRELAEITKADDYIISDNIISLMMSQLSENKELKKVFDVLFTAEGSEIYLKPASEYIKEGSTTNFYTIMQSAIERGETAIGYRKFKLSQNSEYQYGIKLNPIKSESIVIEENDKVIVLALD